MFRYLVIGVTMFFSIDDASAGESGALPGQCPQQLNKEDCWDYLARQKIDEIHALMLKVEAELQRFVIPDSEGESTGAVRGDGTTREPTNHAGSTAFVLPQAGLNHWGSYTASGQLLPGAPIIQGGYYNLGPAHPIGGYTEAGIARSAEVRTTMALQAPTYNIIQAPLIPSPSVVVPPPEARSRTAASSAGSRAPSNQHWSGPGYYGVIIRSARIAEEKPSGSRWDLDYLLPDSKSGPDPFVIVEVGEQHFRTEVLQNTWTPQWNAGRLLWLEPGNMITVKIVDEDVSDDDPIATVQVPFAGGPTVLQSYREGGIEALIIELTDPLRQDGAVVQRCGSEYEPKLYPHDGRIHCSPPTEFWALLAGVMFGMIGETLAGEGPLFVGASGRALAALESGALGTAMRTAGAEVALEGGFLRTLRARGTSFNLRLGPQVLESSAGTFRLFPDRIEQLIDGQWTTITRGPW